MRIWSAWYARKFWPRSLWGHAHSRSPCLTVWYMPNMPNYARTWRTSKIGTDAGKGIEIDSKVAKWLNKYNPEGILLLYWAIFLTPCRSWMVTVLTPWTPLNSPLWHYNFWFSICNMDYERNYRKLVKILLLMKLWFSCLFWSSILVYAALQLCIDRSLQRSVRIGF